jgi:3-oxoacyl-[acyl-carrier protein] reductase
MRRLDGKATLVTGAGSGIGQAVAELFAEEGARVAVNDIDRASAERVAAGVRERGGSAIPAAGDVSRWTEVRQVIEKTLAEFGRIDILVSNAGIPSIVESIELLPEQEWDRVIDVNLKGTFLLSKAIVPLMKRQGGGVILVTGSEMGHLLARAESLEDAAQHGPPWASGTAFDADGCEELRQT